MSPRASSSSASTPAEEEAPVEETTTEEETEEAGTENQGVPEEQRRGPVGDDGTPTGHAISSYPDEVNHLGDMDAEAAKAPQYPPGADIPSADNVRRYPELFSDEVKASFDTGELPETDVERAQREAAEQAEADQADTDASGEAAVDTGPPVDGDTSDDTGQTKTSSK